MEQNRNQEEGSDFQFALTSNFYSVALLRKKNHIQVYLMSY